MSDLKPCPMCGETQIKLIDWPADNSIYEVFCLSCKINTGAKFTKKEAILHWNTRAYEQRIAAFESFVDDLEFEHNLLKSESWGTVKDEVEVNIYEKILKSAKTALKG